MSRKHHIAEDVKNWQSGSRHILQDRVISHFIRTLWTNDSLNLTRVLLSIGNGDSIYQFYFVSNTTTNNIDTDNNK